ncbi:MAG: gluzincin family metallopeptidase [Planctomycetota bacterium]|jgi:hypothetical protein
MRESLRAVLVGVLLAPSVVAQQTDPADPRGITTAWQEFLQQQAPRRWTGEWNPAAGTPSAIYGAGLRLEWGPIHEEDHARRSANGVLVRYARLLGRDSSTFVENIYGKVNHTHIFVYEQRYGGLTVLDGRADVRINDSGVLAMFGSEAFHIPADLEVKPKITAQAAMRTALADLGLKPPAVGAEPISKERLLIWTDRTSHTLCQVRLAWEVKVYGEAAQQPGRVYIDAQTGDIIEFRADRHQLRHAPGTGSSSARMRRPGPNDAPAPAPMVRANVVGTVKGWVNDTISATGALKNLPLGGIRVQVQGGGSGLTDNLGRFSIPHTGSTPVNVTVTFSNARRVGSLRVGAGTPMQVTAKLTPGVQGTIQVYTQNAAEFDRAQSTAYYMVNAVNEFIRQKHILGNHANLTTRDRITVTVNSTQARCNAGYINNTITFGASSGAQCPNFAHSPIVQHEWGHGLDDVFGGISAQGGLSEGWADTVALFQTGQPQLGTVRDGRNTRLYPSGSTPHQQGESWMGGNWKVRQALIAKLGATVGQARAETIVLGTIIANARTQPAAVREVYIADDNDGNLNNGTPNCRELFASYTTTHKIPSPVNSCSATPGSFATFGKGCTGTGKLPSACLGLNTAGGTLVAPPPTGTDLAYAVTASKAMQISAVELYTRALSGTASVSVSIHRNASGRPAASAAVTGIVAAGTATGWYKATFSSPLQVQANERVYIVHNADKISTALLTSGTAPSSPSLARHPLFTAGVWGPLPFGITDVPAWKIVCAGGGNNTAVPVLGSAVLPEIGWPFGVDLSFAKANANATIWIGASKTKMGTFNLPLDLAAFGAGGCTVLTSSDIGLGVKTDTAGRASFKANVPNDKALVGIQVHFQAMVVDAGANPLGLAFSNAATAKVGTR